MWQEKILQNSAQPIQFYILMQKGLKANISQNWALFDISKCSSIRKARSWYTNQGRRIRGIKSITNTAW